MTGLSLLMMMMTTMMNVSEVECAPFIPYPIVPPPAWLLPYFVLGKGALVWASK